MLTVATLMQPDPQTVSPQLTLTMLEHRFLESGHAGFPVVDHGRLVGVVSRSDIVRSMVTERSRAEQVSDFYSPSRPVRADTVEESLESIASQVGVRLANLRVEDVMIRTVVSVEATESVERVAELMLEGHFHRLPVVRHGRLVGLVTTTDLIRAIVERRLVESFDSGAKQSLPLGNIN